jgi:hypothetical protein
MKAATAAVAASSYCSGVALYVAPAGVPARAGLSTTSLSGDSTQRPAVRQQGVRTCCWRGGLTRKRS